MAKLAIRFFILSMLTTSWVVIPIVTQAEAATTGKHIKKRVKVVHQRPKAVGPKAVGRAADPSASPYSSNRYEDDFDRKAAGGGY